jgi:hypothetical protein
MLRKEADMMTARENNKFDVSGLRSKGAREAQKKIAVDGTPDQQMIIRSVIANSFTVKEQRALVSKGEMLFRVRDLPLGTMAQYHAKKDGLRYLIEIDPLFIDDRGTYLHEIVHHSRMVDDSRDTVLLRTRSESIERIVIENIDDRSLEEAATVIEALARETPYEEPFDPSYHAVTANDDMKEGFRQIAEDRELVAGSAKPGSKGLKGKRARKAVEENFDRSYISNLRFNKKSAKERLEEIVGEKR